MTFLTKEIVFPETHWASSEGVLAIGGDLSVPRLLLAYKQGIFPWYNEGSEILWWTPNPRFVLFTNELKISKSMKQVMRSSKFRVTYDTAFKTVIRHCKTQKRNGQSGTWITDEMEEAYIKLHQLGYAHSVEVHQEDELVAGLYGVSLGRVFYGESMFTHVSNGSKFGFISLVNALKAKGFKMIDSQDYTAHLESLGAREIPREYFEKILATETELVGKVGVWTDWLGN
tara:strand:+ start:11924 stop:12610 length:687 start_codon:yes stop_codon:yes gene_type:complete